MKPTIRILFLAVVALCAATLITLSQGCAGSNVTPESVIGEVSHVAAEAQDLEQRLARTYGAFCGDREANVECVAMKRMLADVNAAKLKVFDSIAQLVAKAGGQVVYEDPPEPEHAAPVPMELK